VEQQQMQLVTARKKIRPVNHLCDRLIDVISSASLFFFGDVTISRSTEGKFTTIRESVMADAGEAQSTQANFVNLSPYDQGSIVEFLKTLKVLPPGTGSLIVDEQNRPIEWPPAGLR
jgi:hypothetical protein